MTDREMQEALRGLRDEPLPFESVRELVLARASVKRRRVTPPRWACALAGAAALILLTLGLRPAWRPENLPPPAPKIAAQQPVAVPQPASRAATKGSGPVRRPARRPLPELTLKFYTPDPNVVIYWIVEGQGE